MEIEETQAVAHQQQLKITALPLELLVTILSYLQIQQLPKLETLAYFRHVFEKHRRHTILPLYQMVFNIPPNEDLVTLARKIDSVWRANAIINLPFWGYRTNSGVLYHSLPFWIGKAFLKTRKPIVGMAGMRTGSFSGCLSQDFFEFSGIVQALSRIFRDVYESPDFEENIEQIELKTVIMETFHSDVDEIADVSIRRKLKDLKQRLYLYAIKLNRMLDVQHGPEILNDELVRLPLTACIHRIQLSREFHHDIYNGIRNCIQSVVIGVKKQHTFDELLNIRTPRIASTNLTQEQLKTFTLTAKYPQQEGSPHRYVLFTQNDDGLLLWFDFGSTLKADLPIKYQARVWTSEVHVCILRGKNETASGGLTLSYISLKGVMI